VSAIIAQSPDAVIHSPALTAAADARPVGHWRVGVQPASHLRLFAPVGGELAKDKTVTNIPGICLAA
jgi:hypothetical protein